MEKDEAKSGAEEQALNQTFTGDNVRASWPFSQDSIRANIAHCSPEGKEALISAFLWCIDPAHPMRKEDFAARVGYSDNVLYKLYTGRYVDPKTEEKYDVPPALIKAIRNVLKLEKERFLGGASEFVLTPTASYIWESCDLARESQSPVFIYGPSHIGKTWALVQYAQDNNHGRTVYVRMQAASGLGGMVRRIAERLGVSPGGNTSDLVGRIKKAMTPDMILQLDEMHQLIYTYRLGSFFSCVEVIREIHDECKCGMVICSTNLLMVKMNTHKHGELEQMFRRGVHKRPLPNMPTQADIAAILSSMGLKFPSKSMEITVQKITERPYDMLRQVAKRDGLKAICERLRYGRKLASKVREKLSWDHVVEAHLTIEHNAQPQNDWE